VPVRERREVLPAAMRATPGVCLLSGEAAVAVPDTFRPVGRVTDRPSGWQAPSGGYSSWWSIDSGPTSEVAGDRRIQDVTDRFRATPGQLPVLQPGSAKGQTSRRGLHLWTI
jgi:hypothetical protein